ncbi:MAG: hypothetical protein M1839_004159 [Geoglossum umbratile]|nr:MAG: hypothetical protein M1839_004159 [Geoglossum umbratile]
MDFLNIDFKLDRIHCHDEGDGPGNAEPFMWTVFFKVDGETIVVNTSGPDPPHLQGPPIVVPTPGNHGDLLNTDVDEGDDVAVPAAIGQYQTIMKPIPFTTPIGPLAEAGGQIGCIVVLMEEDNTPSDAIAHGHETLDGSVRDKLNEAIASISLAKPDLTGDDINKLSDEIGAAVEAAIKSSVSALDWIFGWGNMDDKIGSKVFLFKHSVLADAKGAAIPFSQRWDNEGSWEIFGHIAATVIPRPPPACCNELKGKIAELEVTIAKENDRIAQLESKQARDGSRISRLESELGLQGKRIELMETVVGRHDTPKRRSAKKTSKL